MNEGLKYYWWLDKDGRLYQAGWYETIDEVDAWISAQEEYDAIWIFDADTASDWVYSLTQGAVRL